MNILKNWLNAFRYEDFLKEEVFKCDEELCNIRKAGKLSFTMYKNGIKYIRRDPNNGRIILRTPDGLLIAINDHWAIFHEIFCAKVYELEEKYTQKPFVLFDLGLNRAYASLYFSTFDNCKVIYGYEPHPDTFEFAKYNIALNKDYLESRSIIIKVFECGLGAEDATIRLNSFVNRDGVSTLDGCQNLALSKKELAKAQGINVNILGSTNEFEKRFSEIEGLGLYKIMKIDVEGAEYVIINELCKTGLIKQFDLIIGESHNGITSIKSSLEANGFIMKHIGGAAACRDFLFDKK